MTGELKGYVKLNIKVTGNGLLLLSFEHKISE
jgi:hypothetical protein